MSDSIMTQDDFNTDTRALSHSEHPLGLLVDIHGHIDHIGDSEPIENYSTSARVDNQVSYCCVI